MRAGRAGVLAASRMKKNREENSKKSEKQVQQEREQSLMLKYGLEKNPQANKENINSSNPLFIQNQKSKINKKESKTILEFENNNQVQNKLKNDLFDHHQELYENQSKLESEDDDQHDQESAMIKLETTVNQEDEKYLKEFDDITNQLKANKQLQGEYKFKKQEQSSVIQLGELAQIDIRESLDHRLTFKRAPFIIWTFGIIIVIMSIFFIESIALAHIGILNKGQKLSYWWQYFICSLVLIMGFAFLFSGKIHTVILNKQTGLLSIIETSVVCSKQYTEWTLDQVQNVRIFKRGHNGVQIVTVHYEIQIDFKELPSCVILETKSIDKAIKQLIQIKEFLNIPINDQDLKSFDETKGSMSKNHLYVPRR